MSTHIDTLKPLQDSQAAAADPQVHAALSASAGTGKTHVLTARVLRLLLNGVAPESILCLTFTKAAAAEMANRIGDRLAKIPANRTLASGSAARKPSTPFDVTSVYRTSISVSPFSA